MKTHNRVVWKNNISTKYNLKNSFEVTLNAFRSSSKCDLGTQSSAHPQALMGRQGLSWLPLAVGRLREHRSCREPVVDARSPARRWVRPAGRQR